MLRAITSLMSILGFVAIMVSAPLHAGKESAGTVILVGGLVEATDPTEEVRALTRRAKIYPGDTIRTFSGASLQVRLDDGGLLSLDQNSQIAINAFHYSGTEDGTEAAHFDLVQGMMRKISGAIGHNNPDSYSVTTPVGVMGIRGTHYVLRVCDDSCGQAKRGLYGGVLDGAIYMKNARAGRRIDKDHFFYLGSSSARIDMLPAMPQVLTSMPVLPAPGQNRPESAEDDGKTENPQDAQQSSEETAADTEDSASDTPESSDSPVAAADTEDSASDTPESSDSPVAAVTDDTTSDTSLSEDLDSLSLIEVTDDGTPEAIGDDVDAALSSAITDSGTTPPPPPLPLIGAPIAAPLNAKIVYQVTARDDIGRVDSFQDVYQSGTNPAGPILLDESGRPVGTAHNTGPITQVGVMNNGVFSSAGSNQHGVSWGRWGGEYRFRTNGRDGRIPDHYLHYIYTDNPTPNIFLSSPVALSLGTQTYSLAGSTAPTGLNGIQGVLNTFNLDVDFSAAKIRNIEANVLFADGTEFDMFSLGHYTFADITQTDLPPPGNLTGTYRISGTFAGTASGEFKGMFIGPSAKGFGLSYHFQKQEGPEFADGAAFLIRP